MKILGIISGRNEPASRFRIAQYEPYITRHGDCLKLCTPSPGKDADPPRWARLLSKMTTINQWRIWNTARLTGRIPLLTEQFHHDIIWQNRLLLNTYFTIEKKYRKPLAFDIDDAIWLLDGERTLQKAFAKASVVIAGNPYLAEYAAKTNRNVRVVPTAIDTTQLYPLRLPGKQFTIGWIGTHHNFRYLEMISSTIIGFLRDNPDTRLMIVSSEPPTFLPFDSNKIVFRKWRLEEENRHINEFSVGIMPLKDNEWTRGKCSCKMLQYMACGVPVVVSPIGQNKTILEARQAGLFAATEIDWINSLRLLKNDEAMYKEMSEIGEKTVKKEFSCEVNAPLLLEIFRSVV